MQNPNLHLDTLMNLDWKWLESMMTCVLSNFLGAKLSWVLACFPWPVDAWEVCLSDQLVSTAATAVTAVTARLSKALRPRHHEVCPSAHRSCSSKWPGTGSKSQSFQRALPGIVTRVSWPVPGRRSANFDKKSESKANRKNKVASLEHFTNILLRNSPKFHQWCTMFTCFIVIPQLQALHQPVALIPSYITVFQFSPGQVVTVASHLISSSHHLITGLWESERWWWSSTRTCQNASVEPQKWSLEVGKTVDWSGNTGLSEGKLFRFHLWMLMCLKMKESHVNGSC